MLRIKKIRGHKRIWKRIDTWVTYHKQLDLEYFKNYQREYSKVRVRPYSNLRLGNSLLSVPKGKTKQKIIDGLFEIHANWKQQLDALNTPYYLKIWFYHPDVSRSQVVCAIGDFINFYEITFHNPKENKPFPFKARNLYWEHRIDEDHYSDEDIIGDVTEWISEDEFLAHKRWLNKKLKRPHRISNEKYDDGVIKTYHSIKNSDVWLGFSN